MTDRQHARSKRAKSTKGPQRAPRAFGPASDPKVAERFEAAASAQATKAGKAGKPTRKPKAVKGPKSVKGPRAAQRPKAASPKQVKGPRAAKSLVPTGGPRAAKGPRPSAAKRSKKGSNERRAHRFSVLRRPATKVGKDRPPAASPKDEQAAALARRRRIPLALAGLFAVVVLATSFPLAGLYSQRHQLSAAAAQLHHLQTTNRLLAEQQQQLNSKAAIDRLARADYQLVSPGQTLYDVLPPSGRAAPSAAGAPASGDPGSQPLVAPANAPDMTPSPSLAQQSTNVPGSSTGGQTGSASSKTGTSSSAVGANGRSATSFWSRVTNSLEFWK